MDRLLDLPPGFSAVALRESGDAMRHAASLAPAEGAGTVVWVRRFDTVELAVVLEPEEPLEGARRALYAGLIAAGDAISAHAPPEKPLTFLWPDTVLLDGGIIGGVRLAEPAGAPETVPPEWLVLGLTLRTVVAAKPGGGHALDTPFVRGTSLDAEGFEMIDPPALIGSFCRHLALTFDLWQSEGFASIARQVLARLPAEKAMRGIDGNGDLLVKPIKAGADERRRSLVDAIRVPGWLDPQTSEPWL